jgi:hypothetical protein
MSKINLDVGKCHTAKCQQARIIILLITTMINTAILVIVIVLCTTSASPIEQASAPKHAGLGVPLCGHHAYLEYLIGTAGGLIVWLFKSALKRFWERTILGRNNAAADPEKGNSLGAWFGQKPVRPAGGATPVTAVSVWKPRAVKKAWLAVELLCFSGVPSLFVYASKQVSHC